MNPSTEPITEEGDVHLANTGGTQKRQHLVDPSEQSGRSGGGARTHPKEWPAFTTT